MMLKPLNDNVIIQLSQAEKKTASGIILAGESAAPTHMEGVALAVGPGRSTDGALVPCAVIKGQRVIISNFSGVKIKHDGKELVIVKETDILAIVEEG